MTGAQSKNGRATMHGSIRTRHQTTPLTPHCGHRHSQKDNKCVGTDLFFAKESHMTDTSQFRRRKLWFAGGVLVLLTALAPLLSVYTRSFAQEAANPLGA